MNKTQLFYLLILFFATLGDLIVPTILSSKYPNYNALYETISTLGTEESPVRFWAKLNLIVVGLLFLSFAFAQLSLFENRNWAVNLYFTAIIIYGIGCIIAGIFSEDPKGVEESVSGKIHGISSGLGFLFLILCPLVATYIAEFSVKNTTNVLFFLFGLISFILFLVSENKTNGFLSFTGLFQRINLVILYSSLIVNHFAYSAKSF